MRSVLYLLFTAVAAVAALENPFLVPPGGYQFNTREPTVLNWQPTTPGTVTLKLQMSSDITPHSGLVLAAHLENTGTFTFLPPPDLMQNGLYTVQIIDDNDPSKYNFTPSFMVDGATGGPTTGPTTSRTSMTTSEATTTSGESTTSPSSTRPSTVSPTTTDSSDTTMSTVTSSSTPTTTDSTTTSESTAVSSTRSSSTGMPTSSGAPDPNGAVSLALPGGLLSIVLSLMALL
ncbi:TPA_exp: putative cell wall protein [Trichophyton benhamiae CBS 112371]|uniref:Probable cell wall protein ARB_06477 n=2 Tax=Trichophyton TaxID=5550 RepID=A6477_ARTBC|nr:GPI anchored protein, putative [Trichophyton benhamiae CBS 112371]XP_003025268.1 GPI anchored protein, putative [Trichophyton verrucosum HKI 0517]D4AQH0.1 RecName: Full=Probable cell wall protein ARB_06477; Flags: Precursor [Trichophyton benhamiae CBS 112371]EFE34714.1 GPI anchored protein, putative [Trichophyton benhamiae CBS 112371]EFE44657.1 GPI anchored protein, putative [Trichophyton verrucosum HKI 0517]DAA77641.1 TPA_exp: putative cell wall protein [Trichophyton benhamiae CBS 112371]